MDDNIKGDARSRYEALTPRARYRDTPNSIGSDHTNLELSRRRAEAMAEYLKKMGTAAERMIALGSGKIRPIASNDTEEGRAQNRRTEFEVK